MAAPSPRELAAPTKRRDPNRIKAARQDQQQQLPMYTPPCQPEGCKLKFPAITRAASARKASRWVRGGGQDACH